jgi:hypothetical protein
MSNGDLSNHVFNRNPSLEESELMTEKQSMDAFANTSHPKISFVLLQLVWKTLYFPSNMQLLAHFHTPRGSQGARL